jgi:hypothetical protein
LTSDAADVSWCGVSLKLSRTNDPLPVLCDDPNRTAR